MKKYKIYIVLLIVIILSFVILILDSKTVYTIEYHLNNTEQKALEGDSEAMNLAFNYYMFYTHKFDKAESLFRELLDKGYDEAKVYLGMVLSLSAQIKDKYLEGIVCLKEAIQNIKSKRIEKNIKTILYNPKYSYSISDLKKYKCNQKYQ